MSGGGGGGAAPEEGGGGFGEGGNVFGEAAAPEVELNLTALMDILSNLLFFLLASFGATIIMAINTTVPTQSADKSDVADTSQSVTVNVSVSKTKFSVSATGTQQTEADLAPLSIAIQNQGDNPDYAALKDHLYAIKQKYPRSDTMILTPDAGIRYDTLIKTMDAAREKVVTVSGTPQTLPLFPSVVISTLVK